MRLSDVLRDLGLDALGVASLLLFMTAFGLIVWRTYSRRRKKTYDEVSRLPLED